MNVRVVKTADSIGDAKPLKRTITDLVLFRGADFLLWRRKRRYP